MRHHEEAPETSICWYNVSDDACLPRIQVHRDLDPAVPRGAADSDGTDDDEAHYIELAVERIFVDEDKSFGSVTKEDANFDEENESEFPPRMRALPQSMRNTTMIVSIAAGALAVASMRLAFSQSSAWYMLQQAFVSCCYPIANSWPWHKAFPEALSGAKLWRTMRSVVPVVVMLDCTAVRYNPPPMVVSGPNGLRFFKIATALTSWVVAFGFVTGPGWTTHAAWWNKRARPMFELSAAMVAAGCAGGIISPFPSLALASALLFAIAIMFLFFVLSWLVVETHLLGKKARMINHSGQ